MKKILLISILIIILPFMLDKFFLDIPLIQQTKLSQSIQNPQETTQKQIILKNKKYSYSYFSPQPSQQLIFDLNLENKKPSLEIIKNQNCKYLINGGFYNKKDEPIGLIIKDGFEVSKNQNNSLFNGYLSATNSATFSISYNKPSLESIVAIQTGPVLLNDSNIQKLSLVTDQNKRRMVLAISDDNRPFFISVSSSKNQAEGPLLESLPEITSKIGKKENLNFTEAINLDGGSASTFYTPQIHIKEITTIGSYLCFK